MAKKKKKIKYIITSNWKNGWVRPGHGDAVLFETKNGEVLTGIVNICAGTSWYVLVGNYNGYDRQFSRDHIRKWIALSNASKLIF